MTVVVALAVLVGVAVSIEAKPPAQAGTETTQPMAEGAEKMCPMCQMRGGEMGMRQEMAALLAEAKAAADAGDAAKASEKIAQAQSLMESHHKTMQECMGQNRGKCPMCGMKMEKEKAEEKVKTKEMGAEEKPAKVKPAK